MIKLYVNNKLTKEITTAKAIEITEKLDELGKTYAWCGDALLI